MRVSNNQIKQIKDKKATVTKIGHVRESTQSLKYLTEIIEQVPVNQHIQLVLSIQQMCDAIATYLNNAVNTSLKDLKPFDPESYITRKKPIDDENLTLEEFESKFKSTNKMIETLKTNIKSIGLTWYNKVARSIDDNIVTPLNTYSVPTITAIAVPTALLATLAVWKYGELANGEVGANRVSKFMHSTCEDLRALFGDPKPLVEALVDPTTKRLVDPTRRGGLIPMVDHALAQFLSNRDPLIMLGSGYVLAQHGSMFTNKIKPWFDAKVSKTWNFLRGGAYEQNNVQGYWDFTPQVNFDSMIGLDPIKKELLGFINDLENLERTIDTNQDIEKGWLLTGESRAGKTFTFDCLSGEIERRMPGKYKFWKIDAASLKALGFKTLFEWADAETSPVVIFVDEIHLLLGKTTDSAEKTLLHDFLTTMEQYVKGNKNPKKPIILFAATNQEWLLEPATRGKGRFGKEVRIEFPTLNDRKLFFIHELSKKALNLKQFDINALALKTEKCSFEAIKQFIGHAITQSWLLGTPLTHEMLEDSLNSETRDILIDDRKDLPLHEREILASHFAGRAICLTMLNTNIKLDTVTIKGLKTDTKNNYDPKSQLPSITYGALITKSLHDTIKMSSRDDVIGEIKTLIAGFAAEQLLIGSCGYKCHPESNDKAYDLAKGLVFEGINQSALSKKARDQKLDEAYAMLDAYKHEVVTLLESNRKKLEIIRDILLYKGILSDSEVNSIIALTDTEIESIIDAMNKQKEEALQQMNETQTTTPA